MLRNDGVACSSHASGTNTSFGHCFSIEIWFHCVLWLPTATQGSPHGSRNGSPTVRPNSTFLSFRKRVPTDIQRVAKGWLVVVMLPSLSGEPDLVVSAKIGSEVTFSLRTRDPTLLKLCLAAAPAQIEEHFQAVRTGPRSLSTKTLCGSLSSVEESLAVHIARMGGERKGVLRGAVGLSISARSGE